MKKIFNLSGKYNTMIMVIVGGVVAVLVISLLLIRPAWSRLKQLGQEIPQAQQARDLKRQDYEHLQAAAKFFKENSQTVERVNATVPVAPEVPSILVTLETLAKQNGVFLTSFSPQQLDAKTQAAAGKSGSAGAGSTSQSVNPAGVESIEITANFSGPYPSLLSFLYNLERSLRIVDVKTITVTSTTGGLEGTITFRAYYVPAEGGPQPAATAAPGAPPAATPAKPSGGTK